MSDAYLQDVLNWLGEQLGATYSASLSKKRIYRDELIVKMNLELGKAGSRFSKLSEILTSMTNKPTGIIGLTFGSEGSNNLSLVVERRANTPFEENRYFSVSGLQTAKHIEALVSFEQIMSDG